jgi:hypothetical protein
MIHDTGDKSPAYYQISLSGSLLIKGLIIIPQLSQKNFLPPRRGRIKVGGNVHPSPSQAPPRKGSCPGGRLSEPAAIPTFPHRKGEGGEIRNPLILNK